MDTRVALKPHTELCFYNAHQGKCIYTITHEIGRGDSCIVYEATYRNNSHQLKKVRIKECYPFRLTISRINNELIPVDSEKEAFSSCKKKMQFAFDLGNELFNTSGLTNFTSNMVDIYELNNTLYVVTTYQEGAVLSYDYFTSLKDCIRVVKSTAKVIDQIHRKGYLYLDIKPSNIFSLSGTSEVIQLFDFDSLIPIKDNDDYMISYTKGFSALELSMGQMKRIGKHTDIYALGALLFYLLFNRCPTAPDCEMDAVYSFETSKYAKHTFQDALYQQLTDFFKNTLANYYLDRYQDMHQVISKLEEIEKLADTSIAYIVSQPVFSPKMLVGRNNELSILKQWVNETNSLVFVLTGMGGIGKSSLVRSFIVNETHNFDVVLYTNYQQSLIHTIASDDQWYIHTLSCFEQESEEDYFYRKISRAKRLTEKKQVLLVIDHYDQSQFEGLDAVLRLGWKVLIVSRNSPLSNVYPSFHLTSLQEKQDLYTLFENYYRQPLSNEDELLVEALIAEVQGHTFTLELIAKQASQSFLSLHQMLVSLKEHGVLKIAKEKVAYQKDDLFQMDTIQQILNSLFTSAHLSEEKMSLLKTIAFFGQSGISVSLLSKVYPLENKDVLHELNNEGWLTVLGQQLTMHPLMMEIVLDLEVSTHFQQLHQTTIHHLKTELLEDHKSWMHLPEAFIKQSKNANLPYHSLMYHLLMVLGRHCEKQQLTYALELLQNQAFFTKEELLRIYEIVCDLYEEQDELEKVKAYLQEAKTIFTKNSTPVLKAQYFDLWVGYYDFVLDGRYDAYFMDEKEIWLNMMKSLNTAIHYIKKSNRKDLLAEYLRCKANIYIRSFPKLKSFILLLLHKVDAIIKKENFQATKLHHATLLTWGWYYTYVEENVELVKGYLEEARQSVDLIYDDILDVIDCYYVPAANMLFECHDTLEAAKLLHQAILLCQEHDDVLPFIRKKEELMDYLLEVHDYTMDEQNQTIIKTFLGG